MLAEVSAPTVSRFEAGEKDIQLSSAFRILRILGMLDERTLAFPNPRERYDGRRDVVVFWGLDGEREVECGVTWEALEDHFQARRDPLQAFVAHERDIEREARRKYLAGRIEDDGAVLIRSADLLPRQRA